MRDIALGISQREKIGDFNADDGWLLKFMERNKFSFRQVTNPIALSDDRLLQCTFEYMKLLQTQILQSQPPKIIKWPFILKILE